MAEVTSPIDETANVTSTAAASDDVTNDVMASTWLRALLVTSAGDDVMKSAAIDDVMNSGGER